MSNKIIDEVNRANSWQTIESAPKDGTLVDIYIMSLGERYTDSYYAKDEGVWCWDIDGLEGKRIAFTATPPTHWMPLPKPPEGT